MKRLALLIVAATSASGCPKAKPLTAAEQQQWTHDSAEYEVKLAKFLRDSTVTDSVSRTINTDSLYRLFHAALAPQPIVPITREMTCEFERLSARYGAVPAQWAMTRMTDTLWRSVKKSDVDAMDRRLNNASLDEMKALGSGQFHCGIKTRVDSLNGTNLLFYNPHPLPVHRPGHW
jgi:hypothetical protein